MICTDTEPGMRRGAVIVVVSIAVAALLLVLLLLVRVIPRYQGFFEQTAVTNGAINGVPVGSTCGAGEWQISAPSGSEVVFQWSVLIVSTNASTPANGWANVSIVESGSAVYSSSSQPEGSGEFDMGGARSFVVRPVLCTDGIAATLSFWGNSTTWTPLL
jgi:hypothetical protein